jgi:hypothetical protein
VAGRGFEAAQEGQVGQMHGVIRVLARGFPPAYARARPGGTKNPVPQPFFCFREADGFPA